MLQPNSWAHPIISLKTHIRIGPIYTPTIKPQDPKNTLTQSELCKTFILVELSKSIKARKQGNTQKMQFIDSPVIKLPVRNSLISLQQDNRLMHLGTSVWPCSLVLVKFIDRWAHQPQMTNPYSQQRGVELVRNLTPITFSDYPPNICHSETYPSADTAPSKPENLTRINPPPPTKYSVAEDQRD